MNSKSLSADIARVVRGILAERRMKTNEFADAIGEPKSSVYRWLNDGGPMKVDTVEGIARTLGMEPDELIHLAMQSRPKVSSRDIAEDLAGATDAEKEDLRRAIDRARPRRVRKVERTSDTGT